MNKTELMKKAGIGTSTLAKLGKDQLVGWTVIFKICDALECDIKDIIEIIR